MNPWSWAFLAILMALIPCGWAVLRGDAAQRLAAMGLAQLMFVSALMLLAMAQAGPACLDLALAAAFLSLPAGLVMAHFLGRWL